MDVKTLLNKEIEDEFEQLEKIDVGIEAYKNSVDGITKLVDRAIELEKIEIEKEEKTKNRNENRKDRFIGYCLTIANILIPTIVTIWGTNKSLKFEETGTVTTIMGRGFIQKLLPKK